jgi:osmotically-inducible protein OsmY
VGLLAAIAAPHPARSAAHSDRELMEEITARLARDADLRASPITVEVEEGRARLGGTVATLAQRREAVRKAAGLRGILAVEDRVTVGTEETSDRTVENRLWNRLSTYADLRAPAVRIRVDEGVAVVEGEVASPGRRELLETLIEKTEGVRDDDYSGLSIQARKAVDDASIEKSIRGLIDDPLKMPVAGQVEITSTDGMVVLSGTVARVLDWMTAVRAASLTPGVKGVENRLAVTPDPLSPRTP